MAENKVKVVIEPTVDDTNLRRASESYNSTIKKLDSKFDKLFENLSGSFANEIEVSTEQSLEKARKAAENIVRQREATKRLTPKGENGRFTSRQLSALKLSPENEQEIETMAQKMRGQYGTSGTGKNTLITRLKKLASSNFSENEEEIARILDQLFDEDTQRRNDILKQLRSINASKKGAKTVLVKKRQEILGQNAQRQSQANTTKSNSASPSNTSTNQINKRIAERVDEIKSQLGGDISQELEAKIMETISAEVYNNLKQGKAKVIGRKGPIGGYKSGTPVDESKGVITTRNFDSFVRDGKFIPSSYIDYDGNRQFNKTVAINDQRLANPENIGGNRVGDLRNASLSELSEKYEYLMTLGTKEALEFADTIKQVIIDAYNNTQEEDLRKKFKDTILSTEDLKNSEITHGESTTFRRNDGLVSELRQDLFERNIVSATTKMRSVDYGDINDGTKDYRQRENNGGKDQTNWSETLMEQMTRLYNIPREQMESSKAFISMIQDMESSGGFEAIREMSEQEAKEIMEAFLQQLYTALTGKDVFNESRTSVNANQMVEEGDAPIAFKNGDFDSDNPSRLSSQRGSNGGLEGVELQTSAENVLSSLKVLAQSNLGIVPEDAQKFLSVIENFELLIKELGYGDLERVVNYLDGLDLNVESLPKIFDNLQSLIDIYESRKNIIEEKQREEDALPEIVEPEPVKGIIPGETSREIKRTSSDRSIDDTTLKTVKSVGEKLSEALLSVGQEGVAREIEKTGDFSSPTSPEIVYNTIGKILTYFETVDASIERKVAELNEAAGENLFDTASEMEKWRKENPERALEYDRSKQAAERFNKAGGIGNIDESLMAFFEAEDEYILWLKEKYDGMTKLLTNITKTTDDNGNEVEKRITRTGQETVKLGLLGRLDTSGTYKTPDKFSAGAYYSREGIKGEELGENNPILGNKPLSPALRTSLAYQAGYTGAVYGGKNIQENLANAQKRLEEVQKQLAENLEEQGSVAEQRLKAEEIVLKKDIETLKQAQEVVSYQKPEVVSGKPDKTGYDKDKEYRESKAVQELFKTRENLRKDWSNGVEVTTDSGYRAKIIGEKIIGMPNDEKDKYSTGEIQYYMGTDENGADIWGPITKVLVGQFVEHITDYFVPEVKQELESNLPNGGGSGIVPPDNNDSDFEKGKKSHIPQESNVKTETGPYQIWTENKVEINANLVEVNAEVANIGIASATETIEQGTINIASGSITGNVSVDANGEGAIVQQVGNSFEQFARTAKLEKISPTKVEFIDKDEFGRKAHTYKDEQGNTVISATQFSKLLTGFTNPKYEAQSKSLWDKASRTNGPVTADMFNMDEESFRRLAESSGASRKGDIIHAAIDALAKTGKSNDELSAEWESILNSNQEFQDLKNSKMKELNSIGLGDDFVNLQNEVSAYINLAKEAGIDLTKLSEQVLAFTMEGNKGTATVALTFDQLVKTGQGLAMLDTKTGVAKDQHGYQLGLNSLGVIANKSNPDFISALNAAGINPDLVPDSFENFDEFNTFIVNLGEKGAELIPYLKPSADMVYALTMWAKRISEGDASALSKDEQKQFMGSALDINRVKAEADEQYRPQGTNDTYDARSPLNRSILNNRDVTDVIDDVIEKTENYDSINADIGTKIKSHADLLNKQVKAIEDAAKANAKIKAIEDEITKLQEAQDTNNDSLIADLTKELEIQKQKAELADKEYKNAAQARESLGLDKAIENGEVRQQDALKVRQQEDIAQINAKRVIDNASNKGESDVYIQGIKRQDKLIKQYIQNLEKQYKLERDIEKVRRSMEGKSGTELRDAKNLLSAYESQLAQLKGNALVYDANKGTLGGIELTQENINRLESEQKRVLANHETQLANINSRMREEKSLISEIVGGFKASFRNLTDYTLAYEVIGLMKQSVNQVIASTKELDSALVDIQIASGMTRNEVHDLQKQYADLADELGRTTAEVSTASNDWLRAGYEGKEATELTSASMHLSTLGMIEASDATSYLISVLKGWKIEASEVMSVVDKLSVNYYKCGVCLAISIGHKLKCG